MNQSEPAHAALLAASRGAEPHAAEKARELLGPRYPYVYEFRRAVELDPENAGLRRELGFLFLAMNQPADAEREFDKLVELRPDDLWAAAQLGLLRLAREDRPAAMPLLEKVLNGPDEELADRVREALKLPKTLRRRAEVPRRHIAEEAKSLAAKSLEKGYLQDAAKYLAVAHEKDPLDFDVMLKLGWTHNTLKDDRSAVRWFKLASNAPEPVVAKEAAQAAANLEPQFQRIRVSSWIFPLYSSRWKNVFNYSQVKTEFRFPGLPFTPYFSTRFVGDARGRLRSQSEQPQPQFLSETALIFALGVATPPKHGATLWAEAGLSVSYLGRRPDTGLAKPDYRGGLAFGKGWGRALGGQTGGLFFETNDDAVFVSRFQNDVLFYSQNRIGYTFAPLGGLQLQLYLNKNVTADRLRQYWANFAELGPGLKLRFTGLPQSMYFTANLLRGVYLVNRDNPGAPRFRDLRIGLWYAR
ncbi:MAG: tetratricopeptide repeat protein [Bryobacteraceae bacterium]|nr:tetratricopeptide repeat protein [Bryobacteraceae bacterium]